MNEFGRQSIHVVAGLGIVAIGVLFGKPVLVQLLLTAVAAGLFIIQLKLMKKRLPLIDWVLANFERSGVEFPGKGAMHYFAGALFLVTFAKTFSFALAGIAILALADGLATIVGRFSKKRTRLNWHPAKTWEGTLAFFLSGVAAATPFIGLWPATAYSFILALVESVDVEVDDNLLIPVAALVLNYAAQLL